MLEKGAGPVEPPTLSSSRLHVVGPPGVDGQDRSFVYTSLDSMGCNLITFQDLDWLDRPSFCRGVARGGDGVPGRFRISRPDLRRMRRVV